MCENYVMACGDVSLLHTGSAVDTDACPIQVRFCVPADRRNYWGSLLVTAGKLPAKTALATFSIITFYPALHSL